MLTPCTVLYLEILGGTSLKAQNILLTEKHLELLGEHQLKKDTLYVIWYLELLGGSQLKKITCTLGCFSKDTLRKWNHNMENRDPDR